MSLKNKFKKLRNDYVVYQVKKAKFPIFTDTDVCRYKIIFTGRVQKVGFRLEVKELSERLGLTGYCMNLDDGRVLCEFQGSKEKIEYLIKFMESLIRIKITHKEIEELSIVDEKNFIQR